jgi:hypothetical protein
MQKTYCFKITNFKRLLIFGFATIAIIHIVSSYGVRFNINRYKISIAATEELFTSVKNYEPRTKNQVEKIEFSIDLFYSITTTLYFTQTYFDAIDVLVA